MKLIEAFKNPVKRPRAIIWTGTIVIFLVLFVTFMVGATTTYWFCSAICHNCQDDTITAYQASTHSKISCVSCHMPAGADPVTYLIHKVEALAEIPPTLLNTFEIPLNPLSTLALSGYAMGSTQCTQCHAMDNRVISPSPGIIMNHDKHAAKHIACAVCHNRIAHNEEGMKFANPKTREGVDNPGHMVWTTMTSCYRCHRLADDGLAEIPSPQKADGACLVCHPKDFDLVPDSHKVTNFIKDSHGKLADAEVERVKEWQHEAELIRAAAHGGHGDSTDEGHAVAEIGDSWALNECYTCHGKSFCSDCHGGVEMPHPDGFGKDHSSKADDNLKACQTCHGQNVCTQCHHSEPNVTNYKYNEKKTWLAQHYVPCDKGGEAQCFTCHEPTFCAKCHVRGSSD